MRIASFDGNHLAAGDKNQPATFQEHSDERRSFHTNFRRSPRADIHNIRGGYFFGVDQILSPAKVPGLHPI